MKKLFYGLGAVAAVVTPVVAVVSCGSKDEAKIKGDFTALKALADQVENSQVEDTLMIQGGSTADAATSKPVSQFIVKLSHDQTVEFFKGIGLLTAKDADTTAASQRFGYNWDKTPLSAADAAKPFQKAVEAFIKSGALEKLNSFVKSEYEKFDNENATRDKVNVVSDDLINAEFHSEGYAFGVAGANHYVETEARNQGNGGYSYLSFKVKLEDTALEGGFVAGGTKPTGTELLKFNDAQNALVHAFTELSNLKAL